LGREPNRKERKKKKSVNVVGWGTPEDQAPVKFLGGGKGAKKQGDWG